MRAFRLENSQSLPEFVAAERPAAVASTRRRSRKRVVAPVPMIVAPRLVHELHNVMMEVSARAAICVALSTRPELRSHLVGIDAAVERGRALVRLYAGLVESGNHATAAQSASGPTDPLAILGDAVAIIGALSGRRVAIAATAQARKARVRCSAARLRSRVVAMMTRAMDRLNAGRELHWSVSIETGVSRGVILELRAPESDAPRARHVVMGRLVLAPASVGGVPPAAAPAAHAATPASRTRVNLRPAVAGRHAS
ncbi:MAG: hypothetical protein ACK55O_05740 [Phycisphaerales bacterium]